MTFNSFVNFVGIISNVMPAPDAKNAPVLGLTNTAGIPSTTTMAFTRIQIPNATTPDIVHDTAVLQINNTGDEPLVINGLTLSDTTNWELINPPAAGTPVPAGSSLGVTIKFIAAADPSHTDNQINDTVTTNGVSVTAAGGTWTGTLTISTNAPVNGTRVETLKGFWQYQSESENEPGLQTIVNNLFQWPTNISNTATPDFPNNGTTAVSYGSEVLSGLWNVADSSQPVSVTQLAAYHNQYSQSAPGTQTQPKFGWYASGSSTTTFVLTDAVMNAQTILPLGAGSSSTAATTFTPSGTFGLNIDTEKSQDAARTLSISTPMAGRVTPCGLSAGQCVGANGSQHLHRRRGLRERPDCKFGLPGSPLSGVEHNAQHQARGGADVQASVGTTRRSGRAMGARDRRVNLQRLPLGRRRRGDEDRECDGYQLYRYGRARRK